MGHVEDRWFNTIPLPEGKSRRVKTKLFGKGMRYRVRYIAPGGRECSKSFPDGEKKAAQDFLVSVESDKREMRYIDPRAGKQYFGDYARRWFASSANDESTNETTDSRLRNHILPFFELRQVGAIKPSVVREWDVWMKDDRGYAEGTRAVSFTIFKAIMNAAKEDKLIGENPCDSKSVIVPRQEQRKVVPWTDARVAAVRGGLSPRYRAMVDVGAGCGLRQGEIFGLSNLDLDLDAGLLTVARQIKRVRSRLVFGLPKNDKSRIVPLPKVVAESLAKHVAEIAPVYITLPWENPDSERLVTVSLIFTNALNSGIHRCNFDQKHWQRALRLAGVDKSRQNGMHALRHFYASVLLDGGVSIKAVSEYLGHWDPAFTLRTYTHLMPGSEERARTAVDEALKNLARPDDGLTGGVAA